MADKKEIRILGFNITKISAHKNPEFKGKLEIASNINISSIEEYKTELSNQQSLQINFSFTIDYKTLGKIELQGALFLSMDPKMIKEAISTWKQKKLSTELNILFLNIIMQKASFRSFQLEEELGLPTHIQLPRLQPEESK